VKRSILRHARLPTATRRAYGAGHRHSTGGEKHTRFRTCLALIACLVVAAIAAGAASAGEITGNGKALWTATFTDPNTGDVSHSLHANSICAFSGQDDLQYVDAHGNPVPITEGDPGHSQSWGQLVSAGFEDPSALRGGGDSPGSTCNGHSGLLAGGGGGA